ncbi:hypothetical protein BC938DRAFT_480775 [Jimgerdemannia flammicorona]|uniref:Uncharacterized protein n=1 Tax=Jimgerdemannia flammicorona TaxID=994334 RepID=A0A433QHQ3_9FUNG|nr:hypothetical protein BC938DRAFT_480775 [Jimgerdemannia flammicorona]
MSKLTQTPPLIDLNPRTSIQEVQLYLKEPIIPRAGSRRKRLGMQALNAFARLELLLSKEEALKDGMSEKAKKALTSEIGCTVATLEAALAQHFEGQNVYMQEMNLSTVFPKSAKRAGAGNGAPATRDIHSHFQQMSLTNQLVSMALQLQHDLKLTNHKYMAHQVALLYLPQVQVPGRVTVRRSQVANQWGRGTVAERGVKGVAPRFNHGHRDRGSVHIQASASAVVGARQVPGQAQGAKPG